MNILEEEVSVVVPVNIVIMYLNYKNNQNICGNCEGGHFTGFEKSKTSPYFESQNKISGRIFLNRK